MLMSAEARKESRKAGEYGDDGLVLGWPLSSAGDKRLNPGVSAEGSSRSARAMTLVSRLGKSRA